MPSIVDTDILTLWRDIQELIALEKANAAALAQLAEDLTSILAHLDSRFDQLEGLINPVLPPEALQYYGMAKMAVVTTINLTAGGSSDEIVVEDQNGNALPQNTITWSTPVGESSPADLTVAAAADGSGFTFSAGAVAPTESVTVQATWTDPTGANSPVTGPTLTVQITAASGTTSSAPTSLQYNEVSGS